MTAYCGKLGKKKIICNLVKSKDLLDLNYG